MQYAFELCRSDLTQIRHKILHIIDLYASDLRKEMERIQRILDILFWIRYNKNIRNQDANLRT